MIPKINKTAHRISENATHLLGSVVPGALPIGLATEVASTGVELREFTVHFIPNVNVIIPNKSLGKDNSQVIKKLASLASTGTGQIKVQTHKSADQVIKHSVYP